VTSLPFGTERDVVTAPIEQRDANLHLELADLLAERWLRRARRVAARVNRLDAVAKNRNPETLAVSRGMSYEGGPRSGDPVEVEWYSCALPTS
jgi:hypothetical protein